MPSRTRLRGSSHPKERGSRKKRTLYIYVETVRGMFALRRLTFGGNSACCPWGNRFSSSSFSSAFFFACVHLHLFLFPPLPTLQPPPSLFICVIFISIYFFLYYYFSDYTGARILRVSRLLFFFPPFHLYRDFVEVPDCLPPAQSSTPFPISFIFFPFVFFSKTLGQWNMLLHFSSKFGHLRQKDDQKRERANKIQLTSRGSFKSRRMFPSFQSEIPGIERFRPRSLADQLHRWNNCRQA